MDQLDQVDRVIDVFREALVMVLQLSLPLLLVGLVVGLSVSLFQAMTQIQEQTLAFIPKILAVVATLIILMPTLLRWALEYTATTLYDLSILSPGTGV
ncbi:MAG: flagellar biosynthetic protein FliQ [Planctomycetota bacterium]